MGKPSSLLFLDLKTVSAVLPWPLCCLESPNQVHQDPACPGGIQLPEWSGNRRCLFHKGLGRDLKTNSPKIRKRETHINTASKAVCDLHMSS